VNWGIRINLESIPGCICSNPSVGGIGRGLLICGCAEFVNTLYFTNIVL